MTASGEWNPKAVLNRALALAVIPAPIASPVGRAAALEGLTGVLRRSLVTISAGRGCE